MGNKVIGKCHICGEHCELTFEHIPPRAAFNSHKVFMAYGEDVLKSRGFPWSFKDINLRQQQKGVGNYTLCGKCNNDTGSWYGREYVDFTYKAYRRLEGRKLVNRQQIGFHLHNIYPLRIIKEILAMFLSVNNSSLADVHPELRKLILSREYRGLSNTIFGIGAYLLSGSIARYIGMFGKFDIYTGKKAMISEYSAPPFGYFLEINPKDKSEYLDITDWANKFAFDDCIDINLSMPVYECNSMLPSDHRSKREIIDAYVKSELIRKNL